MPPRTVAQESVRATFHEASSGRLDLDASGNIAALRLTLGIEQALETFAALNGDDDDDQEENADHEDA